jgi:hypothetical protein
MEFMFDNKIAVVLNKRKKKKKKKLHHSIQIRLIIRPINKKV